MDKPVTVRVRRGMEADFVVVDVTDELRNTLAPGEDRELVLLPPEDERVYRWGHGSEPRTLYLWDILVDAKTTKTGECYLCIPYPDEPKWEPPREICGCPIKYTEDAIFFDHSIPKKYLQMMLEDTSFPPVRVFENGELGWNGTFTEIGIWLNVQDRAASLWTPEEFRRIIDHVDPEHRHE